MSELKDLFDACTEVKLMKDGTTEIHCKCGLWSVSGHEPLTVQREAVHYFTQYYQDGEYEHILHLSTGNSEIKGAQ